MPSPKQAAIKCAEECVKLANQRFHLTQEIERLNAHVAMLREALILMRNSAESYGKSWAAAHVADFSTLVSGSVSEKFQLLSIAQKRLKSVPNALAASSSDWLINHDKQVRDAALEEAAKACIEFGELCSEVGRANIGDCFAEEIRLMKGKP